MTARLRKSRLKRRGFVLPEGRYALVFEMLEYALDASLWYGESLTHDTRLYDLYRWGSGGWKTVPNKSWSRGAHMWLLTDDEATRLLTAAKLLDLRGEAWLDYVTDFVSTLTNEGAPA